MKTHLLPLLRRAAAPAAALLLLASGCSTAHLTGAMAGGTLGAVFGSSIGGLSGGPRGAYAGRAIGLVAGAAVGTAAADAATRPRTPEPSPAPEARSESPDPVAYGSYPAPPQPAGPWGYVEVTGVTFADAGGNHVLNAGEHTYVSFEIYNRGDRTLRDVAPVVACDNRRIRISPTAIIGSLPPGRGVRYRAAVVAGGRLRPGEARFTVSFGTGRGRVVAKRFSLRTAR